MLKKLLTGLLLLALLSSAFVFRAPSARGLEPGPEEEALAAYRLLFGSLDNGETTYVDYLLAENEPPGTEPAGAWPEGGQAEDGVEGPVRALGYRETAVYRLSVKAAGWYWLKADYRPAGRTMSDFTAELLVNGRQDYMEMGNVAFPLYWRNAEDAFPMDSYGDESAPRQQRVDAWRGRYLNSRLSATEEPLLVRLDSGVNDITLTNTSGDGLVLGRLQALPPGWDLPDYEAYHAPRANEPAGAGAVAVNAIHYLEKNDAQAVYASMNDPSLTPHDSKTKRMNVLSWRRAGTEVTYAFEVPSAGNYQLSFHYMNGKAEFDAFHTVLIDGQIPFSECVSYAFPVTNGNWANETLGGADGTPYLFYLGEGRHTLTLRMELAPVMRAWRTARLMAAHVMRFSLKIVELAGSQQDRNRTWKMTRYLPDIAAWLDAYVTLVNHIKALTQGYSSKGAAGAMFSELDKVLSFVEDMRRYPDEIALYISQMTGADNSIIVSLSRFTTQLADNDFSLDMAYFTGDGALPPARAGLLQSLGNWGASLFNTFTTDKYRQTAGDGETLTVWANRALSHVDLLQKMVDTDFTAKTGIRVKLSALTDPGRLTLSASAGATPDIALGLPSHMPFDLASRGALKDLRDYPDFWEVAARMPAGTLVPYLFNEGVYAVPETLDFACLVYRRDIFDSFGFRPPDTWADVVKLLPELQRYGMNFFHNIAQGTGYKWFYQTTPLIYQHGGMLYTEDGLRTAINRPEGIAGIQALGNLFIAYSLDKQVTSFFDAFRYAVQPVGIIDSATYILLKNGAPELQGQWSLAPYPGTPQADGSVSRWFVANGQGGVVFKGTKMQEEAWAFLKWWLSHETQADYGFQLRSTYGDAFLWLPSNLQALADAPLDRAELDTIIASTVWLRDVPRTPGQYILERSISDIWNAMVNRGASAQVAVDEKVVLINREIRKKMTELGFYDREGNPVKPYAVRDIDWIKRQMDGAEGGK